MYHPHPHARSLKDCSNHLVYLLCVTYGELEWGFQMSLPYVWQKKVQSRHRINYFKLINKNRKSILLKRNANIKKKVLLHLM